MLLGLCLFLLIEFGCPQNRNLNSYFTSYQNNYYRDDQRWLNDERPVKLFDVSSVQERTNYPFHNVRFDDNEPIRQIYHQTHPDARPVDAIVIPSFDDHMPQLETQEEAIVDHINLFLSNKDSQDEALKIVDSKDKSLMEKLTDLTTILAGKKSGIEQSELFHEIVENDRSRQNVMAQLRDSLSPEYKEIADGLVQIQKNVTLSDNEKTEIQGDVLEGLAAKAKQAFRGFEALFRGSRRAKRQVNSQQNIWTYGQSIYVKTGDEAFPSNGVAPLNHVPATEPPPFNRNSADKLTKNRYLVPTPLGNQEQSFPPSGFFPDGSRRPPVPESAIQAYGTAREYPVFTPPPPRQATPPPPSFGMDLSENVDTRSQAFEDRDALFDKNKAIERSRNVIQDTRTLSWNNGNQFIQQTSQVSGPGLYGRVSVDQTPLIQKSRTQQQLEAYGLRPGGTFVQETRVGADVTRVESPISPIVFPAHPDGVSSPVTRIQQQQQIVSNIAVPPGPQYVDRPQQGVLETNRYSDRQPPVVDVGVSVSRIQSGGIGAGIPFSSDGFGQFDTNIGRYDTGDHRQVNKVVLPDDFMEQFNSQGQPQAAPAPVATQRITQTQTQTVYIEPGNVFVQKPSPFGSNTGIPSRYIPANLRPPTYPPLDHPEEPYMPPSMGQGQARKIVQQGGFYPVIEGSNTRFGTQTGPIGTHGDGLRTYGADRGGVNERIPVNTIILTSNLTQSSGNEPNTVYLTKDTRTDALEYLQATPQPTTTSTTTTTTEAPEVTAYTTYPDYRQGLFPIPLSQAQPDPRDPLDESPSKIDPRPASWHGRRQGMFGGGTNEYREDLGKVNSAVYKNINTQRQYVSAVDDRSMKGYIDPTVRYGPVVSLENSPLPPYDGTSRANKVEGYMEGHDLSVGDPVGARTWGRIGEVSTTRIPWNYQTTTVVPVPQIDIDSKLPFPANQGARPSDEEIISARLSENAMKPQERGQMRAYYGPEEITRSRYVNVNPPRNNERNGVSNRFVKIDLQNHISI